MREPRPGRRSAKQKRVWPRPKVYRVAKPPKLRARSPYPKALLWQYVLHDQ